MSAADSTAAAAPVAAATVDDEIAAAIAANDMAALDQEQVSGMRVECARWSNCRGENGDRSCE